MKGVYEQNKNMGDPSSLEPQITETTQNIGRLRGELTKYEVCDNLNSQNQCDTTNQQFTHLLSVGFVRLS